MNRLLLIAVTILGLAHCATDREVDGKPVHFDTHGEAFVRLINERGVAEARARFDAERRRDPAAVLFEEKTLNAAGYKLLGQGRVADAIEVFRMNVEAYPQSANVYDSLAEAYLANKQNELAIELYRKTLELAPGDDRVMATLARLGAPLSDDELAKTVRTLVPPEVELIPNVDYGAANLHVLRPSTLPATPLPAIVFIHGGGWTEGSKERGIVPLLHFVRRGYVGVTIGYRLTGTATFPAQIDDVKEAIRFVRANAARFSIDPRRIAVWGQSAGGHLAALAGTSAKAGDPSRPDAVIDWNGPADLVDSTDAGVERLLGGSASTHRELAVAASPVTWVTPDDPPFLILHGDADRVVDISQSRKLHDALRAAGVESTLRVFEGEAHFGLSPRQPVPEKFRVEMDAFLDRHFSGAGFAARSE